MQKETDDTTIKIFVTSKDQVAIRCPKCGVSKTLDVSNPQVSSSKMKVTCKCGEAFRVKIEFRKRYRKEVKLPGKYVHLNSPKRGEMLVLDLSLAGIGFTTSAPHELKVGDHLDVFFRLDNTQRSEIRLKVVVRSVNGLFVGAERTDTAIAIQDLGFYLM